VTNPSPEPHGPACPCATHIGQPGGAAAGVVPVDGVFFRVTGDHRRSSPVAAGERLIRGEFGADGDVSNRIACLGTRVRVTSDRFAVVTGAGFRRDCPFAVRRNVDACMITRSRTPRRYRPATFRAGDARGPVVCMICTTWPVSCREGDS